MKSHAIPLSQDVVAGEATIAGECGLQSNRSVTLINARPGTILRSYGYKMRSVDYAQVMPDLSIRHMEPWEALQYLPKEK